MKCTYSPVKKGKLRVKADENVLPYIVTKVKNRILHIGFKRGYNFRNIKYLSVQAPVEQIESLTITGSGDVDSDFTLKSPHMQLTISGSGDMDLALDSDTTAAKITGSGDLKLSGQTRNASYTLTGSGDIKAMEFRATNARAEISGSGDIHLYCSEKLEARYTGSGDIRYKGGPKIRLKVTGSGSISNY